MTVALSYPHVVKPTREPAHLERMPRIRVAQIVMDYLAHGWSPDEMCRQHPHLRLAEAHAAMAYYYDHQDEIGSEIQVELKQCDESRRLAERSPLFHRLHEAGQRSMPTARQEFAQE